MSRQVCAGRRRCRGAWSSETIMEKADMTQGSGDLMDKLTALTKRRGFIFQSSEIYGGINGFWDYGPLGVELKRNIKDAWWQDIVRKRDDMVGLDCSIIMNPQGLGGLRPRRQLQRPAGGLQGVQGPLPRGQGLRRRRHATARTCCSRSASRPTTPSTPRTAAVAGANSKTRRRLEQTRRPARPGTIYRVDKLPEGRDGAVPASAAARSPTPASST